MRHWARDRGIGAKRFPPIGLREAVLRLQHYPHLRRHTQRIPMLETVRQWACGVGCTKAQWQELVRTVSEEA